MAEEPTTNQPSSPESAAPESAAPEPTEESEAAQTPQGFDLRNRLQNFANQLTSGISGGKIDKKQLTKVAIAAGIVIVVMGIMTFMIWGLALWAIARATGEPSNASAAGSSFGELTFPATASTPESIACLDNWLKNKKSDSPLNGKGNSFVSSGQTYNVNPALVLGIAGAESTFATNWRAINPETKNYQSMKCDTGQRTTPGTECIGDWAKYPTWEKSIEEHNKYLRTYYLDKGINTIPAIGKIYCGSGCSDWIPTTTSVFNEIIKSCPGFSSPATGSIMYANLIVIDPGHGSGKNSFAKAIDGINNEGDHNWLIATKVKQNLQNQGYNVLLTKDSARADPALPERVQFANSKNAALFVSLHSNSNGGPGPIGIIYCPGPADGKVNYNLDSCANDANAKHGRDISRSIVGRIVSNLGLSNPRYWGGDLGVLGGLKMPGALIEMFAHDQTSDLDKINGKEDALAKSISDGITQIVKKQ